MARLYTILFFVFLFGSLHAVEFKKVEVDKLFEFTSIVWRLSGAEEYSECYLPSYVSDIDRYFSNHKKHPLIKHCKRLRSRYSISFDAISSSTAFLCLSNGRIVYSDGYNAYSIMNDDERWGACDTSEVDEYVRLLGDFYRVSNFERFWNDHSVLYDKVKHDLDSLQLTHVNYLWFEKIFGMRVDNFNMFVSINNGPHNYALPKSVPPHSRGMLLGLVRGVGKNGLFYSKYVNKLVVHELMHTYSNQLIKQYCDDIKEASMTLFEKQSKQFISLNMGVESVPYEWFNRLLVIMYYMDVNDKYARYLLSEEIRNGFFWMAHSVEIFSQYIADSSKYNNISDFMSVLIEHYLYAASHINEEMRIAESVFPNIVSVIPKPGSKLNLSEDTVTISVHFDSDMNTTAEGIRFLVRNSFWGKFLKDNDIRTFWKNKNTYLICISSKDIKRLGFYGFILNGRFMMSFENGVQIPMLEDKTKILYDL